MKTERAAIFQARWLIWGHEDAYTRLSLKTFGDFGESVEYINQCESGYGDTEGEWYFPDDSELIVYVGSFGNDHSPGSDRNTCAEVYRSKSDFDARVRELEQYPEWLDSNDDE